MFSLVGAQCFADEAGRCSGSNEQRVAALTQLIQPVLTYRKDAGRLPEYIEAVVPRYLAAVPEHAQGYAIKFDGGTMLAWCNFDDAGREFEYCEVELSTSSIACRNRVQTVTGSGK